MVVLSAWTVVCEGASGHSFKLFYEIILILQNPKLAAIIGIFAVLASTLGLFNPRGEPFVFHFQVSAILSSLPAVYTPDCKSSC
jgi:hypothetical protein